MPPCSLLRSHKQVTRRMSPAEGSCNTVTLAALDARLPPLREDLRRQLDEELARVEVRRRD